MNKIENQNTGSNRRNSNILLVWENLYCERLSLERQSYSCLSV